MISVSGAMLDLCKLIADCQFQQQELKPQAVVIHDVGKLWCFYQRVDGSYTAMTEQGATDDQALWYSADPKKFVKNCLPGVIQKNPGSGDKNIAFLDMEIGWDHEQLLKDWAKSQEDTARQHEIFVQTFRQDDSNRPIKIAEAKLPRTQKEPPVTPKPPIVNSTPPTTNPTSSQETLLFDDIRDIPAEFAYFVWKSRRSAAARHQSSMKAWHEIDQAERSLTTREIAERIYEKPSISEVVSVFKQLRSGVPQYMGIPMIGFDQNWLFATSYLIAYSGVKTDSLDIDNLTSIRYQRYKRTNLVQQPTSDHITASVTRCLAAASEGLRLFDLTEDVICDLTGNIRITLSLADVCHIRKVLVSNLHTSSTQRKRLRS